MTEKNYLPRYKCECCHGYFDGPALKIALPALDPATPPCPRRAVHECQSLEKFVGIGVLVGFRLIGDDEQLERYFLSRPWLKKEAA